MSIRSRRSPRSCVALAVTALLLASCAEQDQGSNTDPAQVDSTELPEVGACRLLTPEDVAQPANATKTIPCTETHTAETYAVGELPAEYEDVEYDDAKLAAFAYQTCGSKLMEFLTADESAMMRTVVNWAWFRPSEEAWEQGARWYRCDVTGGGPQSESYLDLPETAKDLLAEPKDEWMVCVNGPTVRDSEKIPCSEPHTWRAVTTIKLGQPEDPYPGDDVVSSRTEDFCSDSVAAWLGYPPDYEFGFTWHHEAEWEAGNRRSVCWAKTDR